MTLLQAIDVRRSRRTYINQSPTPQQQAALHEQIEQINGQSGLHLLLINSGSAFNGIKSKGMFSGVNTYVALSGSADDPQLSEKMGYYGQLLMLHATALGLGSCWVGGTFDRNMFVDECRPLLADGEKPGCAITIGPVRIKPSTKETLVRAVTHKSPKTADMLYDGDISLTDAPEWLRRGVAAVVKAPSANNRQPVSIVYKNGIVTATAGGKSAVDLGIAKLHFAIVCGGVWAWGDGGIWTAGN